MRAIGIALALVGAMYLHHMTIAVVLLIVLIIDLAVGGD